MPYKHSWKETAANAEKEKQYTDLIAKADGLFDGDKLEEAKSAYQEALGIKAGEAHPTGRIEEINKKLNELSSQAELDKKYTTGTMKMLSSVEVSSPPKITFAIGL